MQLFILETFVAFVASDASKACWSCSDSRKMKKKKLGES